MKPFDPLSVPKQSLWHYFLQCRYLLLLDTRQIDRFPCHWHIAQKSLWMILWFLPFYLYADYGMYMLSKLEAGDEMINLMGVQFGFETGLSMSLLFLLHQPLMFLLVYYISRSMIVDQNYPRWILINQGLTIWAYSLIIAMVLCVVFVPALLLFVTLFSLVLPICYAFFAYHHVLKLAKSASIILIVLELIIYALLAQVMAFL